MAKSWRYGTWQGGRDPLEAPYDVREALDALGDDVLAGSSPAEAMRRLLRRGTSGLRGLDELRRRVRQRQRAARNRGRLDGTLRQVRELLDRAVELERRELFPDPSDAARLAESELDALPPDTARAVRQLADYQWRSDEARAAYDQIQDLLRSELLDSQFHGMRDALRSASEEDIAAIRDMVADLNAMLAADARGEHTQEQFDEFMRRHGQFFPENPANLRELVDSLARRAAAQQRLMNSLRPEQRQELSDLMSSVLSDMGLASEMDRLNRQLRAARPDLRWRGRERMSGQEPLGLGDATTALEELADLDELDSMIDQDYAGASLDDVDPELVERTLGQRAVEDMEALRRIERELARQGYLTRTGGQLELTPRAVRRLGATALKRVFAELQNRRQGQHDITDAGSAGDLIGSSRQWQYGDEQPLDVTRTVRNAVLRAAGGPPRRGSSARGVRLAVEDFEVAETERRTRAAVALLVDLSYSMELRGTWGAAKQTALALHSLITTKFPQDALQIIGFSNYARELSPSGLAGLSWDMVQGTNLQHGLIMAQRHLSSQPDAEPVIMVITDGEPTAHLEPDGQATFAWPPLPETVALSIAEVDRCTRRGVTINVFMLGDEPGLVRFVNEMARRNGGRVFSPSPDRLGEFVVRDYLRARRGRRARGGA